MPTAERTYVGGELDLFKHAARWKRYWSSRVRPHLAGDVLEVGAGIASNTLLLRNGRQSSWTCLEPDPALAARARQRLAERGGGETVPVLERTLDELADDRRFTAILYIDVLEHIADDRGELARAAGLLAPGGRLVVLVPAHQGLFSPFDEAVGHHRRYSRRSLRAVVPATLGELELRYLDAAGLFASLANRLMLRQELPSLAQIKLWDRVLVPGSRLLDPLFGYSLGRSLLGIWRRRTGAAGG